MRKRYLLIFSLFLLLPFVVKAAEPKVLTLEAEADGSTINYHGTMEDGSHAVMCKLYNSDNEEVYMLSSEVDNHAFADSFTVSGNDDYTVACANYEGGEIKTADVSVDSIVMYSLTLDVNGGTLKDIEFPNEVPEGTVFELDEVSEEDVAPPKGKVFDAYEINGTRYEIGDTYTVTGDTTVKLVWKNAPESKGVNANSPKTYDAGILTSVILIVISVVGIICLLVFRKKKK